MEITIKITPEELRQCLGYIPEKNVASVPCETQTITLDSGIHSTAASPYKVMEYERMKDYWEKLINGVKGPQGPR